jgi:integrase
MCLQTNVVRRGAVYYVRVGLPSELMRARASAGLPRKLEVLRTLGTKDPKEAKRLGPQMVARLHDEFARELDLLRNHVPADGHLATRSLRTPSDADIEQVVWDVLRADLKDDENIRDEQPASERRAELRQRIRSRTEEIRQRVLDPRAAELISIVESLDDDLELNRASVRAENHAIEHQIIKQEHPEDAFGHLAAAIIADRGWDLLPGTPRFRRLCVLLGSARLRALRAFAARDDGDLLAAEANPLRDAPPLPVAQISKARARRGESLLDLLDIYLKEQTAGLSSEEVEKKKHVAKLFSEHLGQSMPVRSIGRAEFRTFKQALANWPVTARNMKCFRGKNFNQIVDANKKLKLRTISPQTINNYISALGAFFGWLHSNGYHDEPRITQGMLVKHDKASTARESYTDDQLAEIFSMPLFTGAASQLDVRQPGEVLVSDWRFWIPLICLYTGGRLGEIAQLRTSDVQVLGGRVVLQITDEGEDMNVKTKDSVRTVPVHGDLVRLGLMNYLQHRVTAGDARLWPELKLNRHGRFSGHASKWWRQHLQQAGIAGDSYKFRHTFIDALRRAGHLDHEIGPIVGHSAGSITHRYGNLPQVTLDRRATMINDVVFPMIASVPTRPD